MKLSRGVLILAFVFSLSAAGYAADDSDDESSGSGSSMSPVLMGALGGGLLGGGLGAAIGSASGNAGKGALIGAGIGAVGGTLVGANQQQSDASMATPVEPRIAPAPEAKVKKRVIREYDEQGRVVSEKEVPR